MILAIIFITVLLFITLRFCKVAAKADRDEEEIFKNGKEKKN